MRHFHCLHFLPSIRRELGGVVAFVLDLCGAMAALGHRVTLATCDAADAPPPWLRESDDLPRVVQVRRSPVLKRVLSRHGSECVRRLLADVDVAHLHTPWEPGNLQIARLLRARGIPYVLTPHGMLDHWSMQQKRAKKFLYLRLAGGRLIRDAAAVHFTAQSELEQARQWLPADSTTSVQPCLLDLSAFDRPTSPDVALKAHPEIRTDAKKILFLSRIHPKKGLEILIDAAAVLSKRHVPLQLLVAGPGEESYVSQLKRRANDLGVSACFLGMAQGEIKRSLYRLADLFVLPTYQENFGIVQAEAMASATPVVTTKGVDVWRELEQGGARIAEHDPHAIAAAVSPLLADSHLRDAVGAQGQAFVRQWLDPSRVAAGYQRMYETAIGGAADLSLDASPQTAGG